jgi:hypothetical protein
VGGPPAAHKARHVPVCVQCTRQLPVHVTSQVETDVHVTTLVAPTVGAHRPMLVQENWHWAPQVGSQTVAPLQSTVQCVPQLPLQVWPLAQDNVH